MCSPKAVQQESQGLLEFQCSLSSIPTSVGPRDIVKDRWKGANPAHLVGMPAGTFCPFTSNTMLRTSSYSMEQTSEGGQHGVGWEFITCPLMPPETTSVSTYDPGASTQVAFSTASS